MDSSQSNIIYIEDYLSHHFEGCTFLYGGFSINELVDQEEVSVIYVPLDFLVDYSIPIDQFSLCFDKPLDDDKEQELISFMRSNMNSYSYHPPYKLNEIDDINVKKQFLISLLVLIIMTSLIYSMVDTILKKRTEEIRIYRILGATRERIIIEEAIHINIINLLSVLIGLVAFVVTRANTINLIAYNEDSLLFYVGNIIIYILVVDLIYVIRSLPLGGNKYAR